MIILSRNFAKINMPYRHILSIIKRTIYIFVFLLLIIPAKGISEGNEVECDCCHENFEGSGSTCPECAPCGSCSGCRNENCDNVCDCGDVCDDECSHCGTCRACGTDTCLGLQFNANSPDVIIPNQEVIFEVTATGGEPTYEYTWSEAVKQTTPYKGKLTGLATDSKTISCTVEDRLGGINRISCEATHIVNVCNVDLISPDITTAIMKDGSEDITITTTLSEILPDDGEIEWQKSTDGGANWSANISGENETQITLANTETAGKYKYRARVEGHTGADDGWQTSADLYIIEFESIDGYIYGESDRKIEGMQALSERANIVASGYIKFKATVQPDDLYFKWSATDGTLTDLSGNSPEGAGNNYKEVKFDAPDGHEQNVTLTLEIKENAGGNAFHTETVDLKTIRPYLIRVKFVNDQHIPGNCSVNEPEFDATQTPVRNGPICYVRDSSMQVELDIAGNKTDDSDNNFEGSNGVVPDNIELNSVYKDIYN